MMRTVLVGYGHAARSFHLPAIWKLQADRGERRTIGVVDVVPPVDAPGLEVHLDEQMDVLPASYPPDETIVHVCTPPADHAAVIDRCASLGYRRMIVEKPLVSTREHLNLVEGVARDRDLDILVVSNWLFSRLTAVIEGRMATRPSSIERVTITSSKSRIAKSLAEKPHASALDIEMPHLVAAAIRLCGPHLELRNAWSSDLFVNGEVVPLMGSADMMLRGPGAYDVHLSSNLRAPRRSRMLLVRWSDGTRLTGHYPCDRDDHYAQLTVSDSLGAVIEHEVYEDDTVLAFLTGAYDYFEGNGQRPISDLRMHVEVTELLLAAREYCERQHDSVGIVESVGTSHGH